MVKWHSPAYAESLDDLANLVHSACNFSTGGKVGDRIPGCRNDFHDIWKETRPHRYVAHFSIDGLDILEERRMY